VLKLDTQTLLTIVWRSYPMILQLRPAIRPNLGLRIGSKALTKVVEMAYIVVLTGVKSLMTVLREVEAVLHLELILFISVSLTL